SPSSHCSPIRTRHSARRIRWYPSVPKEIDSRSVSASRHLTDSFGEVNKNLPPKFNALATLRMTTDWISGGIKNIKPHAITPSNVRPKNSESSTAEHSTEASGNRWRNAATNFLDASTP